jgi:type I restriction enzyme R subunit
LADLVSKLVAALDPDAALDQAREKTGQDGASDLAKAQARRDLIEEATRPLAANPELRQRLIDIRKSYEQSIDTVSTDSLIEAGFSAGAADHVRSLIESFQQFIEQNRDEIAALQVLYNRPYRQRLTYRDIKALADALQLPPRSWTPDRLWQAYQQLDRSKVRGSG